ncbi:MAG TPA: AarF/UbiB family protein [Polyangiaceae bacterium]|nr:AarF/UbiB family protein [Polyangiaceae bacterium]
MTMLSSMVAALTAVRDLGRLRAIAMVLAKHGFGEVLGRMGLGSLAPKSSRADAEQGRAIAWPERVRLVLEDLGPSFMKLGQIASTRTDLLPPELISELKKLQDDVPPVDFGAIKEEVEASLAASIGEIYADFEERPLAAATIGQVHRARLRAVPALPAPAPTASAAAGDAPSTTGSSSTAIEPDVAVKVQRPGVRATIERDVELLGFLAAVLDRSVAEARAYDPMGLVREFDRSITAELDFTNEAANAQRFRQNFEGHPEVAFPRVYKSASAKRVLTTEFFDGFRIDQALQRGVDGKKLARMAVRIVVKMIFEDGFFHADPHPGNIIIQGTVDEPVIGLVDLGMVGRLSPELRNKTVDLMVAAARKDSIAVADALYAIGRPTAKVDMPTFRAEVSLLAEKFVGLPLREIELSALIRDLVAVALKFGLEIPTDFMMVGKALMTLEGMGRQLDPDLDVFQEAQPYFLTILRRRYGPERLGGDLLRGITQFAGVAHDVPLHLQEVLDDLRAGRLEVRTVETQLAPGLDRLGRRVFSGFVVASLNVAAGLALISSWRYRVWGAAVLLAASWIAWAFHVSGEAVRTWWSKGRKRR